MLAHVIAGVRTVITVTLNREATAAGILQGSLPLLLTMKTSLKARLYACPTFRWRYILYIRTVPFDEPYRLRQTQVLLRVVPLICTYAFTESDSLDDFLDRTMLNLYEQLKKETGTHAQTARLLRIDPMSSYQRVDGRG